MEFHDRLLTCVDCGAGFLFTAGEQLFFHDKHFQNEPKRCRACKVKRVAALGGNGGGPREHVETQTVCATCGRQTTVPFRPTQGRPVLCRDCFQQRRAQAV
ncbi:MAG: zinc-ribbon domain containing protein [Acidobacteria bacterium]|nr:zinc-ribbon domain containing protein [Acidobacteriota bacterium]